MHKISIRTAQYNLFVDGGQRQRETATVTHPSYEGLVETVTGAGIMGELEVVTPGHHSALTLEIACRMLGEDLSKLSVGSTHTFDLRSAVQTEDVTTAAAGTRPERYQYVGVVKSISHGTLAPASFADATISVAVRRAERWIDGRQVLKVDVLNSIYVKDGEDMYAQIRAAIGG